MSEAYYELLTGEISLEEFLQQGIEDIFYEVRKNTHRTITDELREKFLNDALVKQIAKKYDIDLICCI